MALRSKIFLITLALLALLITASSLGVAAFLLRQNRVQWKGHCSDEAVFLADQSERMVIWDDRVALRDMLKSRIGKSTHIIYAFIEQDGRPYAHTFGDGVPDALKGFDDRPQGSALVRKFVDGRGRVFFDFAARVGSGDSVLHLGMPREAMDARAFALMPALALIGLALFAICVIPAWMTAGTITADVDRMTTDLQNLNDELETRVEDRTSELMKMNEALEEEIKQRRALEKQKMDFFAMVTHDLKTPISVISGYAELVLSVNKGRLDGPSTEMLESISRNSRKLNMLVNDFLLSSRIERVGAELDRKPVDVALLVGSLKDEFDWLMHEKGIAFVSDVEEGLPPVLWDGAYVQRAVANMLKNAATYTQQNGRVALSAKAREENGVQNIELSVSDNGPGIPPEEQGRIFEKYYSSNNKSGAKGTGLGLAIVSAVARAHRGRVELESEPGKGSTFRMVLPLE